MSVVPKKRQRSTVFYVVFTWQGKRVWERVGTDRREADRINTARMREVRDGTYTPEGVRRATTVRQWARQWMDERRVRSADDECRWLESYVLTPEREWFASMPLDDVRPRHVLQLVTELGTKTVGVATKRPLTPKSIANIYGVVRTMLRDARIKELIHEDPCVLPRGTIRRGRTKRRDAYSAAEVLALTTDPRVPIDARVFNALAFYTGMREGEVCGRRWRDLDRRPRPLACLTVDSQYEDQPLKTDKAGDEHPRRVPIHPELAAVLETWWAGGFEFVCCRKPAEDDFIVPRRDGAGHTRSSAYKLFRRACGATNVPNRTLHATRTTFVSLARRGGARKDVLERVTHNAAGDIVDAYTRWDWSSLCEAVLCFRLDAEQGGEPGGWLAPRSTAEEPHAGVSGVAPLNESAENAAEGRASPHAGPGSIPGASTAFNGTPEAPSTTCLRSVPAGEPRYLVGVDGTRRRLAEPTSSFASSSEAAALRSLGLSAAALELIHPELVADDEALGFRAAAHAWLSRAS